MNYRVAVFRGDDAHHLATARTIREIVFCGEQGVPPDLEWDGHDGDCTHVLLFDDERPIATGRLRLCTPGVCKIERVAVLRENRRSGAGRTVMRALLDATRQIDQSTGFEVTLHAQQAVIGFYQRLGFVSYGATFMEAGILHVAMRLVSDGTAAE